MVANGKRDKDFFEKLDGKTLDQLDGARNATMSVDDVDWEDLSTQLYYMLALAMPEDSAGEAIMRFVTNADVANEIEKLDLEISKYGKAAGEQLTDNIKKGILLGALQNERDLQKHVFRNLRTLVTYFDAENRVLSALKPQRSFDDDAMEIGALTGMPKGKKAKDDCRKFRRENEAEAEANNKAKDEKKQRRAVAAALVAGGGAALAGLPPGCDGAGQRSQHFAHRAVHGEPQQHVRDSSGAASTASTTPTAPTGTRGINGLLAEQDTIKPKYIFALMAEHSRPRARSAEPSGSRRSESSESVCVSDIRGVRGVTIDSGAQVTAFPCDMLKGKDYVLAKSGISKLRAIDGAKVQRYGETGVRLNTGQGKSVIHSPLGDWIVDSPISPPASANQIKLRKDRGTCYLEYDEMLGDSSEGKRAARTASIGELDESISGLGGVGGEQLGDGLYLNCDAQGPAGAPRVVSAKSRSDDEHPVVQMDFFYVATDEIARKLDHTERGELPAILNAAGSRSNASGTLFGSKHMGDYKAHFVAKLIDSWGHATVIPLADGGNAIVALAQQAKKLRQAAEQLRDLLRTLRFALETKLGCKLELSDSILAFPASTIGRCIARFLPRSHGGSRCKFLFGREHAGEVAEVGEQVRRRVAALVAAGQGKFEARFAKGIWVGKSEFDDQHLAVDLQRGLLEVRSARRMPQEFRWNAELAKQIDAAPSAPVPERAGSSIRKSMYIAEIMLSTYGPTGNCPKCSYGRGQRSEQRRQRFNAIAQERLEAKLAEEARGGAALGTPAAPGPAPQAPPRVPAGAQATASSPAAAASSTPPTPAAAPATPGMDTSAPKALVRDPAADSSEPNKRQRVGALVQAPVVVVIAGPSVCELVVCAEARVGRCAYRRDHAGQCARRRCLIGCAKKLNPDAEVVASLCALWSRRMTREQPDWGLDPNSPEPTVEIHYDYYTGDPLDEEKYQKGKADELQAMAEHGVYRKIRIAECEPGGKHVGGFPVAHDKAGEVRWRFVATEVTHQHREDNHQGTPPLAMIRAILSLAASKPDSDGQHRRCIRISDVRKAFFNSDLTEKIYVHPGSELRERGYGTVRGPPGQSAVGCAPGMLYFANPCSDGNDATMGVHGDDFIAEGHVGTLDQLVDVLSVEYGITSSPPLGPGHPGVARYLKRVCGYVDQLPETRLPGFFWHADPKHVTEIVKFGPEEGAEAVDTPGTKAIGAQLRNGTDPVSRADRPDIMFVSKTIMQDVSRPNNQMNARLIRLARYLEGHQVLVWCYELQDLPSTLRADGDADWAAPTAVARKSTSGGTVRFGSHTWECYSTSQATQALSSGESEFYALGSFAARGLQMKFVLDEVGIEVRLVVASDSAAARGMAQRRGVGKVRHLELRYLWMQERIRLQMFELVKEDARKMVADILTKYVDKDSTATHLHELSLRMTGAAMVASTPPAIPGARAAEDQCEMGYEGEKFEAVQSGVSPWLLVSLVVVLCSIAHLCGWYVGRHKVVAQTAEEDPRAALIGERHRHHEEYAESKQQQSMQAGWRLEERKSIMREVQRLYEVYTVGELRELPVERGPLLKDGYTREGELVESAGRSSPTEMQVITQLTTEWKDHGIDAR
ncbi:unnamed protein product [Prorocentrum cordatum]|uniref:Reverse transcriptase Ty1/copia-type domain-containing protein n=1 Tax=Prorocentrum cordatum TaxID=2364126 RepID=A0ABN9PII7_9DINO|nr:unnamed protein product [Polarella glacialis]